MSDIKRLGYTDDEPVTLPDGRTVRVRSSSRLVMIVVAFVIIGVWAAVAINMGFADEPSLPDIPWVCAVLLLGVMFAKDKPLDQIKAIAEALKK